MFLTSRCCVFWCLGQIATYHLFACGVLCVLLVGRLFKGEANRAVKEIGTPRLFGRPIGEIGSASARARWARGYALAWSSEGLIATGNNDGRLTLGVLWGKRFSLPEFLERNFLVWTSLVATKQF